MASARSIYADGLRNAHSLERQAVQLIERQVGRLRHYPDVEARLRQHLVETREQERRLDRLLDELGETRSVLKDAAMSFFGSVAALANTPAGDEILKNTFANVAFEHYEIAAYKSLIAMAHVVGQERAVPVLEASLREEEDMAAWLEAHVDKVTTKYMNLELAAGSR